MSWIVKVAYPCYADDRQKVGIEMKDYSFGNHICALRMRCGLSQFQLGTLVGVSDKAVSKWENGDAKPRIATCYRLAEVLGTSISELLSCEQDIAQPARKELNGMNNKFWKQAYERLSIYGDNPPVECWSRLVSEEENLRGTDAIQGAGVVGKIAERAREYGTTILARGGIQSSFAAWLLGATEVNPLPAHYRCPGCGRVEFVAGVADGYDLKPKMCSCGRKFVRDGHQIPYEGFAQSERDGTHVEILVTEDFKPIGVKTLLDLYDGVAELLPIRIFNEDGTWCVDKYVVLPKQKSKPALDADGFWHTGHEEYWNWRNNETTFSFLVSKPIHTLQKLQCETKAPLPKRSDLTNPEIAEAVYQRRCREVSRITDKLDAAEPHDFDLLLRMESLAHSTGVWEENGAELLDTGAAKFREIPAAREDIWADICTALMKKGIRDTGLALQVMTNARIGKYRNRGISADLEKILTSLGLPPWYPGYLQKICYMFPKGHCVAFLHIDMMMEWYRIHFPEEFARCRAENEA